MSEAFWIALIVGVGSPLLLALMTNWNKSKERAEDRAERQAAALALATVNTKIDGMLVDRDKAKVLEGERKGEDKAATLAEGQRQGAEAARAAAAPANGAPLAGQEAPVPVVDDKVADAITKSARAVEHAAQAVEKKP